MTNAVAQAPSAEHQNGVQSTPPVAKATPVVVDHPKNLQQKQIYIRLFWGLINFCYTVTA
jgi:hypothetical protein